ncbi:unnamed protein product [Adineta ricciae]|uniref:G-protein coupled receptors family 1 profile domain-containing protein n=1 Tax=Adineta ricciae TaxID=249248 RepID=A0A814X7I5_ADIRI|nr:unnamed protein product [Adineta ricciae]
MSNLTDEYRINIINNVSSQINRYLTLFIFLFGIIGSLLNLVVLSQPVLRGNPCVVYFLASSAFSLGILLVGLPSRIISGLIGTDPTNTNSWFCKFRLFFLYSFRTTSAWLIVFAAFDRWCSSNRKVYQRRFSSCQIAYRSILIIYSLSFILWFEGFFCYEANLTTAPVKCYAIPSILMLIFGSLTIRNINQIRRAIEPFVARISTISHTSRTPRSLVRRSESSLTRMLLFQVCLLTVCSIPQAMHQFYLTFTIDVQKSPLRLAIENFIVNLNFSLTYIGNGMAFYIYTLNGTVFRQTLIRLINRCSLIHLARATKKNYFCRVVRLFFSLSRCEHIRLASIHSCFTHRLHNFNKL